MYIILPEDSLETSAVLVEFEKIKTISANVDNNRKMRSTNSDLPLIFIQSPIISNILSNFEGYVNFNIVKIKIILYNYIQCSY